MQLVSGRAGTWTLEAWPRVHTLIHCLGCRLQFQGESRGGGVTFKEARVECRLDWKLLMLSALSPDEHADEAAGSSQLLQPPELWQRLKQQQPSRWHPGLLSGVHSVMGLAMEPAHLFSSPHSTYILRTILKMPSWASPRLQRESCRNTKTPRPPALTWVQASWAGRLGTASFHNENCTIFAFILIIVLPCCCDLPKTLKILLGKGSSPLKTKRVLKIKKTLKALKPNGILPWAAQRQKGLEQSWKCSSTASPQHRPSSTPVATPACPSTQPATENWC